MSTSNYAMVNEHPIYYEQFGIGRPVVLLHGGLHTIHLSFEKQIPVFAQQHHVIAIEQVGHGHSADIEGPFSYAHMAEDTALRSVRVRLFMPPQKSHNCSTSAVCARMLCDRSAANVASPNRGS
jgi:alpha/beta hydrolase family protein